MNVSFFIEDASDLQSPIVAVVSAGFAWDASLYNLLPEGVVGMRAVIQNNCGQRFTYEINGTDRGLALNQEFIAL